MPTIRKPRSGSMQYWPRKRAKRPYPRIRHWTKGKDVKPLGFAGYKAGMTHLIIKDNRPTSTTKETDIFCPVTIIECPPLKVASIRFYKKTTNGLTVSSEVFADKLDKELKRKILPHKKTKKGIDSFKAEDYDDLRLLVYTQPKLTGIGKKKPELFEMGMGGTIEEKFSYAKEVLGKEINVADVLKEGELMDVHAITKGKGLQGPVKRFGIGLTSHKSEKTRRGPGNIGPWTGGKMWTVAKAGATGYHQRTEYNKWVVKIGDNGEEINQKGGILHYGLIKNQYLLLKGSLPGPSKRLLLLTQAVRPNKKTPKEAPQIVYVSKESKQGR